ncbi:HAD family hydrolase [Marinomonas sp. IMCC 4694]|uniref:HAD family hydrolase n=1 Tax=Marinomonas sp. IMCC 4694 TaxID=2605432 RepID=UPI001652D02B|nr:HAD family hydrolase [Marinomonas sp. IMCC 4694]
MLHQTEHSEAKRLASLALIIFDCDGVLVDSEVLSIDALHRLILAEGGKLTKDEVIAQFQGRSMKSAKEELFASQGVALTQVALDAMNVALFARFYQALQPIQGVADFIKSLTLPFCVASSSHPERINVSLDATQLQAHFAGKVFSSTMVKNGKPAPDLFLLAAHTMGCSADSALVIEDSPAGIQAARQAGMLCIGLTAGAHAKHPNHTQKLIDAGANWVVDSYEDVAKIIKAVR